MFSFSTLSILLTGAIMLHVTEEFLFPGGFAEWYQKLVPSKTHGVRPGYLVWINTLMIGATVIPLYRGETERGVSIWFMVAAIAAVNACFHIWGVIKLKIYSPGVITGVLLYIPLFIVGSTQIFATGLLSTGKAVLFLAIAIGYHIFSVIRQRQ